VKKTYPRTKHIMNNLLQKVVSNYMKGSTCTILYQVS